MINCVIDAILHLQDRAVDPFLPCIDKKLERILQPQQLRNVFVPDAVPCVQIHQLCRRDIFCFVYQFLRGEREPVVQHLRIVVLDGCGEQPPQFITIHYRPPAFPKSAALYSGAITCKRYRSFPHLNRQTPRSGNLMRSNSDSSSCSASMYSRGLMLPALNRN